MPDEGGAYAASASLGLSLLQPWVPHRLAFPCLGPASLLSPHPRCPLLSCLCRPATGGPGGWWLYCWLPWGSSGRAQPWKGRGSWPPSTPGRKWSCGAEWRLLPSLTAIGRAFALALEDLRQGGTSFRGRGLVQVTAEITPDGKVPAYGDELLLKAPLRPPGGPATRGSSAMLPTCSAAA